MRPILLIFLCLFLLGLSSSRLKATIEVSNPSPDVGETITLTFDVPVDTLRITYRPNSSVAKTGILVNDPPARSMEWASDNPGLVALSYVDRTGTEPETVSRNLSIRFDGLSLSGIFVMVLAGFILFGGVITAFRTLFRHEEEDGTIDFDPEHVPDT